MTIASYMKKETREEMEKRVRAEERVYLLELLIELRLKGEADGAMMQMEQLLATSPSKYVN